MGLLKERKGLHLRNISLVRSSREELLSGFKKIETHKEDRMTLVERTLREVHDWGRKDLLSTIVLDNVRDVIKMIEGGTFEIKHMNGKGLTREIPSGAVEVSHKTSSECDEEAVVALLEGEGLSLKAFISTSGGDANNLSHKIKFRERYQRLFDIWESSGKIKRGTGQRWFMREDG